MAHGGAKYLCACSLGRGRFYRREDGVTVAVRAEVREAADGAAVTVDFSR